MAERDIDLSKYQSDASAPITANNPGSSANEDPASAQDKLRKLLNPIQLTEDEVNQWWKETERASERVKNQSATWDILLSEYMPIVKASGEPETVKVNSHFRNVHTKIGRLFPKSPKLQCTPAGPSLDAIPNPMVPGAVIKADVLVPLKNEVLNFHLGPNGIKASRLYDEMLFDVTGYSGIAACKIGYRCVMKEITRPKMGPPPAPMGMPGMPPAPGAPMPPPAATPPSGISPGAPPAPAQQVPQLDPLGQPVMETVQVPIYENWYAARISPKKAFFDADVKSTRINEQSTYVGQDFYMSPKVAQRTYGLSEDEMAGMQSDDKVYQHEGEANGQSTLLHGREVWVKAAIHFYDKDPNAIHPDAVIQLVMFEGVKRAVVCRMSPDQTFDEVGRLTNDSMVGFPIDFLTIRDLTDSPFTPSDSAFTNSQIKQMNTHRRQSVRIRDASAGKTLFDGSAFDEEDRDAIKNGEAGTDIFLKDGALAQGVDKIMANTTQIHAAPDDWRTAQMMKADMEDTIGLSGNQVGANTDTIRSATESQEVAQSSFSRSEKEQERVLEHYVSLARKLDSLLQRYADDTQYVSILGDDGAQVLLGWNKKIIAGRFMYEIEPDSQNRVDSAKDRQQQLAFYNLVAKDPLVNRVPILKKLAARFGYDPSKVIADPETQAQQAPHGGEANKSEAENTGAKPNEPGSQGNNRDTREAKNV